LGSPQSRGSSLRARPVRRLDSGGRRPARAGVRSRERPDGAELRSGADDDRVSVGSLRSSRSERGRRRGQAPRSWPRDVLGSSIRGAFSASVVARGEFRTADQMERTKTGRRERCFSSSQIGRVRGTESGIFQASGREPSAAVRNQSEVGGTLRSAAENGMSVRRTSWSISVGGWLDSERFEIEPEFLADDGGNLRVVLLADRGFREGAGSARAVGRRSRSPCSIGWAITSERVGMPGHCRRGCGEGRVPGAVTRSRSCFPRAVRVG
jgi:hypothetical protein